MTPEIEHFLRQDSKMAEAIEHTTLEPLVPYGGVFTALVRAIISQQLSEKVAQVIHERYLSLFEDRKPQAGDVLKTDIDSLRSVGLSRSKTQYILNVADYFDQEGNRCDWHGMNNHDIMKILTKIKGVGEWTVQMILIFELGRPDIFPYQDLGIQQGMRQLYKLEGKGKDLHIKMTEQASAWQPYRSYACRVIWQWRDKAGL